MGTVTRLPFNPKGSKNSRIENNSEEWIGGCFLMPAYVMESEPVRPEVAVWLDTSAGIIVGMNAMKPETALEGTVNCLLDALKNFNKDDWPKSVRVADNKLAEAVRKKLDKNVEVKVAPTPELAHVIKDLEKTMAQDAQPSYLEWGRVSPGLVNRFFVACSKLYQQSPWEYLSESDLLGLDIEELGIYGYCISIIGQLGQSYGALVFDSFKSYEKMTNMAEESITNGTPPPSMPEGLIFSINFERGSDLPKSLRTEIAKNNWPVASPAAYPVAQYVDPDFLVKPLTDKDYELATACADALSDFIMFYSAEINEGLMENISASFTIEDLPCKPTVTISIPHPDINWIMQEDEDIELDEEFDDDLEAQMELVHDIIDDFLHDKENEKKDYRWLSAASFLCEDLFTFKIKFVDDEFNHWTAAIIEEYMLEYFPTQVSADEELIDYLPEILHEFFEWLLNSKRVSKRSGEAILKRIKSKTKTFLREANDPINSGMAKSLMMAMKEAGVDITNESEVQGFIKAFNSQLGNIQNLFEDVITSEKKQKSKTKGKPKSKSKSNSKSNSKSKPKQPPK